MAHQRNVREQAPVQAEAEFGAGRRPASRIAGLAGDDPQAADLVLRMVGLAVRILPHAYLGGTFAFTLRPGLRPEGASLRYSIIALLGLQALGQADQRRVLHGDDCDHVLGLLAKHLDDMTSRGDVALLCWAAAEAGHSELPHAIARLRELDRRVLPGLAAVSEDHIDTVSAAWVVTALAAARPLADVEEHLSAARNRLLGARLAVFPHLIGGSPPRYRAHIGSFADQIYPVQALARLHASGDDPRALDVAEHVAGVLCGAQGAAGQWWWHYDARIGSVVEGYPVYSVHQHAMAPMALLDLAAAGGTGHPGSIRRGLAWLAAPPETADRLIADEVPAIWRKVGRRDRRKMVRGIAAARTALPWPAGSDAAFRPGSAVTSRLFPPDAIDRECRPYELGWLLHAWLTGHRP